MHFHFISFIQLH